MSEEMRALTLRMPWPWAIAHGGKDVENRTWQPPVWLDTLAIHAGARSGWDQAGETSPLVQQAWRKWTAQLPDGNLATPYCKPGAIHLDFSAIVAVAEVRACHFDGSCYLYPKFDEETGRCSPWAAAGQWHWQLANVRSLPKPVPCGGQRRLWRLPERVEAAVRKQMEAQ